MASGFLASSSASIGTLKAGPPTSTSRARKGGRVAAADDSADRAFPADRRDFDRAAAAQLDHHRNHRRAEGKQARADLLAAVEDHVARHRARPSSRTARSALAPRARRSRAGDCPQRPGRPGSSSSVVTCATCDFLGTRAMSLRERPDADNAHRAKLLHQPLTASTVRRPPTSRQSATSRSGATSTRLRRSSIRSTKVR